VKIAFQLAYKKLELQVLNMAADGKLSQSMDLTKEVEDLKEWEDPGRAWIDLVAAFKAGNPAQVRACLEVAKASNWTHDRWTEATKDHYSSSDPEGSEEDAQDAYWEN